MCNLKFLNSNTSVKFSTRKYKTNNRKYLKKHAGNRFLLLFNYFCWFCLSFIFWCITVIQARISHRIFMSTKKMIASWWWWSLNEKQIKTRNLIFTVYVTQGQDGGQVARRCFWNIYLLKRNDEETWEIEKSWWVRNVCKTFWLK